MCCYLGIEATGCSLWLTIWEIATLLQCLWEGILLIVPTVLLLNYIINPKPFFLRSQHSLISKEIPETCSHHPFFSVPVSFFCCVMALPGIFLAWPFFHFESCQVRIIDTSCRAPRYLFFLPENAHSKRRPWRPRQSWKESNRIFQPINESSGYPLEVEQLAPEKWCLENYCPIGKVTFSGAMLHFGRVAVSFRQGIFECLCQIWGRYQRVLHQMFEMLHLKLPVEVGSLPMVWLSHTLDTALYMSIDMYIVYSGSPTTNFNRLV